MVVTGNRVCVLRVLVCVGALWFSVGHVMAGDVPAQAPQQQLQPIPEPPASVGQVPAGGQFAQGSATFETDEGAEFCGLPVCSPPGRFWLRGDYLMWWTNGQRLPSLVTTSPQGTARADAGVLGKSGTTILYGDRTINDDGRSGVRTTIGTWLDACHTWDLEFDYFTLGERSSTYNSGLSTGNPILARPFYNVWSNPPDNVVGQASQLVAFTNVVEGTVDVNAKNYFQSAGASLSYNLCSCNACCDPCNSCDNPCTEACGPPLLYCCRADLIVGLRYYNLSDFVGIHESLRMTEASVAGTTFDIHDYFRARNDFYGSEIGLRNRIYRGRWSLDILTKMAIGNNHQTVTINGQTVVTAPNQTSQTYNAGILASGPNSGVYQRDTFTIIPQLGLELGYQWDCHWRSYVGYDLLYWGSVVQAGEQIDLNVDPRNIPPVQAGGLPFPAFPGRTTSFWAHGVNVGAEFRF